MPKTIVPDQNTTRAGAFIQNSQPDPEDRNQQAPSPLNEDLRQWLDSYASEDGRTRVSVGRQLGYRDGTAVSRYINGKPGGDLLKLESAITALRRNVQQRLTSAPIEIWQTSLYKRIHSFCDYLRRTNEVGVIHGPAGCGKTTALLSYAEIEPLVKYTCSDAAHPHSRGVKSLLWKTINDKRGHRQMDSRWDYIIECYKGSGMFFILDNAQRLDVTGRDLALDFTDQTGCPLVFAGNPSILKSIARNDQEHSRVFQQDEARLSKKEMPELARKMVERIFPGTDELNHYAEQIVANEGYLRSLDKTLRAARVFQQEFTGFSDPIKALKAAHAKSTRNYQLID